MPTVAVLDCRAPTHLLRCLRDLGLEPISLPAHPHLPIPIAAHPDMLLFFARDCIFTTSLYSSIAKKELKYLSQLSQKPIRIIENELSSGYENEVFLNAAPIGKYLICHSEYSAKELRDDYAPFLCTVRQGYAKCATLPVTKNALITADPSIARAALQNGFSVLQLKEHGASLEGYDTGFIGGAASFAPYCDHTDIIFCGCWQQHPQAREIADFCKTHGKTPISSDMSTPLTDIGTIFLL